MTLRPIYFITLALQNGVDIKTLSGMLAHYSAGFTLDTYTHVTTKIQQETADKMGGFMDTATMFAEGPKFVDKIVQVG